MTLCQITPHLNHHYKPTGVYNNWEELQRRFWGGGLFDFPKNYCSNCGYHISNATIIER